MSTVQSAARVAFPFTALVGQPLLQRALLLVAIDPRIGGVLVSGPRGTAKSTAARALAAMLPEAPFVTLPLAASLEQLVGTLNVEDVLRDGQLRLAPGLVARAHNGVLYVDEVNLLPDALVDALLDVAASGINTVERDGISQQHAARFALVGTMNPEEGELRPQLLDRFGLSVLLGNPSDPQQRQEILRTRLAFDEDPQALTAAHAAQLRQLADTVAAARAALPRLAWPDAVLQHAAALALAAGVDGMRADLVMLRAARALAALEGRDAVSTQDVDAVAELALAHRRTVEPSTNRTAPSANDNSGPRSDKPPAPAATPSSEGDWGALPPQPTPTTRVLSTGAWPAKKA
ncbi:magnesium chelatase subunit I [Rhodoferax ferrireducens]|uniref:Magnesium chelatase subunit I n=1 Tax=Rhodoferax ferrireducens TaxID=192843 RepID=A0ABU2CDL6_9BURK|nr:AAA family ATPase [Rhodoferax ferrireducens]MDR7379418.1 magnesium chelatase subunit I [Rhodoferax ferrireducens]